MARAHNMRSKKKGSLELYDALVGWRGQTLTSSNAKRRKALEPTGPTSTPKTSAFIGTPADHVIQAQLKQRAQRLRNYQADAAELLWRYKALQVINQRLRSRLTDLESLISENATAMTLNTTPSTSTPESGRLTYEAGQWKTSAAS